LSAVPANAQEERPWCFAGRPEPACAAFPIATLNYVPGTGGQSEGSVTWNLVEWDMGYEPRRFCAVGRPQPSCQKVLVANFSYSPRIQRFSDLESPYEWEFGALVNRGPAHAVGATVVLGMDGNGVRAAAKARYRRWISRYAAVDAAGGLAARRREWAPTATNIPAVGFTGDVAIGLTDWVSVGVRGDLLWSHLDREPVGATFGEVRLGTRPGIVASVLGLVAGVLAAGASG
ncbi:MAG TPA: hypothetical protein VHG93_08005, partial [Longimicrobium sp.]|nr:hypothetical protein [Longimicrobium sp.]